jgi:hypothetical protein
MLGAYYLHTNSELIWKNAIVFANDREYFDSPFVQKVWYIPNDDTIKGIVITMLKEAHKLGANKKSIIEIAKEMCLTRKELGIELGKNT